MSERMTPSEQYARWSIPDPDATEGPARLDAFRSARDQLKTRIDQDLL